MIDLDELAMMEVALWARTRPHLALASKAPQCESFPTTIYNTHHFAISDHPLLLRNSQRYLETPLLLMENVWHLRRVAENASKACWICYKPTTSVLITPNNKDFFYICSGHLVDKGFCQPDPDEAAAVEAKKKKDELDAEIEKVKKEYDEKQKLKREKRKAKDKEKDKAKEKESRSKDEEEDTKDEKAKDDKVRSYEVTSMHVAYITSRSRSFPRRKRTLKLILDPAYSVSISKYHIVILPLPFTTHTLYAYIRYRSFYQMRLDKIRNAELAKRNRERLNNPANFPSVPSSNP